MQNGTFSCVLIGDGSLLIQCGDAVIDRGHAITAIVSSSPEVGDWASRKGLKLVTSEDALRDGLRDATYDWLFSIANLTMLPERLWRAAKQGSANFHDGPLPNHAGLNAPAWAILADDKQYGVTWHAITDEPDKGDIYCQSLFDISDDETSLTLNMKCFEAGLASFQTLVTQIETGTIRPVAQDFSHRTYHSRNKRPAAFAIIDFARTTSELQRLMRALTFGDRYLNPLGLPKLQTKSRVLNVMAMEQATASALSAPGTVISVNRSSAVIATSDGGVRITSLTDESGAAVDIDKVLAAGERLPLPSEQDLNALDTVAAPLASNEPFFRERLQTFRDVEIERIGAPDPTLDPKWQALGFAIPTGLDGPSALAAIIGALARLSGQQRIDVGLANAASLREGGNCVASTVPLIVSAQDKTCADLTLAVAAELALLTSRTGYSIDLIPRTPHLSGMRPSVGFVLSEDGEAAKPCASTAITFVIPAKGTSGHFIYDANRLSPATASGLLRHLQVAIEYFAQHPDARVSDTSWSVKFVPCLCHQR